MDAVEYLSVLVSIVLGLGITQILMGFARWLEHREAFRVYPPVVTWAGFLLLLHVQTWWSMFGMRNVGGWNFLQFAAVLLQPVILFLMAVLIFPSATARQRDTRAYFHRQRRWFFGLLIAVVVTSLLKDATRLTSPNAPNLAFHAAYAVIGVTGLLLRGERAQHLLAYTGLTLFMAYIALLFAEL